MKSTIFLLLSLLLTASTAPAAIFGNIEAPDGIGTQIANVQGWAYTTTPGAELIQPFLVRINGEDAFYVPCCGDRGDVRDTHPEAPLDTGFSATHNFARTAQQGGAALVQVIVTDTAGGSLTLSKTVTVYALNATIPFFRELTFDEPGPLSPFDVRRGWCAPSNDGAFAQGTVDLVCHNLVAMNASAAGACDQIRYSWDRGSQGLRQTSNCMETARWIDNGDGSATDQWTGLVWELKTEEEGLHSVNASLDWSIGDDLPTGPAFSQFLGELNGSVSGECFAGHCDWRLPTADELQGIVEPSDASNGQVGTVSSCTSIPGSTSADNYFTAETSPDDPSRAITISFAGGDRSSRFKHTFRVLNSTIRGNWHLRAVRRPAPWE